jgi:hypothetical protein
MLKKTPNINRKQSCPMIEQSISIKKQQHTFIVCGYDSIQKFWREASKKKKRRQKKTFTISMDPKSFVALIRSGVQPDCNVAVTKVFCQIGLFVVIVFF